MLRLDCGEPELALQRLEAAETLASEQRLGFAWPPQFLRGAALSAQGEFKESIACLHAGLASQFGVRSFRPYGLVRLAAAMALAGAHEASLAAARDGLKVQNETGYGWWDAELHRLEGIALLALNRLDEGQRALEAALRVAQRQQAKAYELRAAMSMTRLWRDQGKRDEARELLAPVYGWFTEVDARSKGGEGAARRVARLRTEHEGEGERVNITLKGAPGGRAIVRRKSFSRGRGALPLLPSPVGVAHRHVSPEPHREGSPLRTVSRDCYFRPTDRRRSPFDFRPTRL
jgi:hypothetical protein